MQHFIKKASPSLSDTSVILACEGVSKYYGGQKILEQIDIEVKKGEITTVIGPNGSGKTTLIKILMGLVSPDGGKVFFKPGVTMGYVPQRFAIDHLLPLTVRRFLRLQEQGKRPLNEIKEIAGKLDIASLLESQMAYVSGGELQRVLLARALLRRPAILVLDEPVQGLDVQGQSEFYTLIDAIRKETSCAVLMVSHDLVTVMAKADKVICINHHICCQGHPEDIHQHPDFLSLFGRNLAIYTHSHDHVHGIKGKILAKEGPHAG